MKSKRPKHLIVWGRRVPCRELSDAQYAYLSAFEGTSLPTHEWVCGELDRIWDALGMDNRKPLSQQRVVEFYTHPVWLMNGLFAAVDPTSVGHRVAMSTYIRRLNVGRIGDYGGGAGALVEQLHRAMPEASLELIEPHPSADILSLGETGVYRTESLEGKYDCLIAQDVLEHLEDPVAAMVQLTESARLGGYLVFASCFFPIIKCHLPSTFYLRHTFRFVSRGLGLSHIGNVPGAPHALVFKKTVSSISNHVYLSIRLAKRFGGAINRGREIIHQAKAMTRT